MTVTITSHEELERELTRVDGLLGELESCRRQAHYLNDEERGEVVASHIANAINELNEERRKIARDLERHRPRH